MDLAHPATLLIPAGLAALVVWRMYSRIRRMVGRQRLSKVRPWLTVYFFPVLLVFLLLGSIGHPGAALAVVCGTLVGSALGVYGLRLTKFENSTLGLFYTPNAHLGIALSLLLIVRLAYRAVQLYSVSGSPQVDPDAFVRSPLTLVIFGTLAGYYVAYAVGLLRWKRRAGSDSPNANQQRGG